VVSQSYGNTVIVRAFVINRDSQARRLICQTLLRCGYAVSECDSPLFGQDEYAGESLVVVDVRSVKDEVRDFLVWVKQQVASSDGKYPYVMAVATGAEIDWTNHPDRSVWDEILMMPDEVDHLCRRFEEIGSRFAELEGAPWSLDQVSPFELDDESDRDEKFSQRSLAETDGSDVGLSPSRIAELNELRGEEATTEVLPSPKLFHEITENVPYGLVVLGRDEKFLYGNARHAELLGIGMDEAENVESWLRMVCPGEEHCREVIASWRKHVWQKQLVRTYALCAADGGIADIEFCPKLMNDGGLLVTMSDVTDRCRSEEAWLLSDVKFKTLFGSKGIGMALVDRAGRICTVNPALEQMLDYTATELRAMAFDDFVVAEDCAEKREYENLAKKEPQLAAEEVRLSLRKSSGDVLPVCLGIACMDEKGGPFTAYLVREDKEQGSTRVGASTGALKESMLQNRALLEAVPDLVLLFDHSGKVEDVSPADIDYSFGQDLSSWQGRLLEELLPAFWKVCENAGLTESEFHSNEGLVLEFSHGEGELARAHVAGCGRGKYMAVIRRENENVGDVEAGQAENSAENDRVGAAESCEWADQLQTLTSLLNLEIDAMPTDPEKEKRSVLQKHQGRIRAIACLRAARLEPVNGGSERVSVPTYLKALLEELLSSSRLASELGIEAEVDCVSLELPARKAFALGLYVTELISNSIEHGLANFPSGQVYVRLRRSDREAILLVGDNGEGLPPEFDWDRVNTLGFRVVKSLVAQLGARLEIRPRENTEFLIRFPGEPMPMIPQQSPDEPAASFPSRLHRPRE